MVGACRRRRRFCQPVRVDVYYADMEAEMMTFVVLPRRSAEEASAEVDAFGAVTPGKWEHLGYFSHIAHDARRPEAA